MTENDIAALEAAAAAATPGPWSAEPSGEANQHRLMCNGNWLVNFLQNGELWAAQQDANANYIAAANPAAVQSLIASYRALAGRAAPASVASNEHIQSIRDHAEFREDLTRLSAHGLGQKQAKAIRHEIYNIIDARVANFVARAVAAQHTAAAPCAVLDDLRSVVCGIGIVGEIDGYKVIRRDIVIDLIERRRAADPSADQPAEPKQ